MHPAQLEHKAHSLETMVVYESYRLLKDSPRKVGLTFLPHVQLLRLCYASRMSTITPPSGTVSTVHSSMTLTVIPVFPRKAHFFRHLFIFLMFWKRKDALSWKLKVPGRIKVFSQWFHRIIFFCFCFFGSP